MELKGGNSMIYKDKKVLVVGMARSGVAAAQLLNMAGAKVIVNDSKTEAELGDSILPLRDLPLTREFGRPAGELLEGIDALVISPGIPVNAPFVKAAQEKGIYVTGELELASQLSRGTLVAVTGTNGKTTTVSLLGEIFRNAGKVTHVVGNIGYPYSAAAMVSKKEDVVVCEVSSFQMETADTFHPHVGVLTNITEDHLNRHGTMEVYTAMKMRMFKCQGSEDYAIFNADDPALKGLPRQVRSRVLMFSRKQEVERGAFVRGDMIMINITGEEKAVCRTDEVMIPGPHNLENALAAVCAASAMEVPVPVIRHSLKTFRGVEHRIESVRTLDGVEYFNDSKGTNVDSTIKAVQTMKKPTAIILGGYDKHCSFDPLSVEMVQSEYIKEAVLIGETADQIEASLRKEGFENITRTDTMENAVNICRQLADDGWNILLSPACASFDMFSDYEERGRVFKQIVNDLK